MGLYISYALGGLGLFLVSVRLMSNSMKTMSSGFMIKLIKKFSDNKWLSLAFGIVFTTMIQSSDGAVALSIGLIAAGFMTLKGAIPFVLGANIGTTITSIFVYLGGSNSVQFTQYFMILAFIGGFAYLLIKEERKSNIAMILFSFGALFIGLKVLSIGVKEIAKTESFINIIKGMSFNSWVGAISLYAMTGLLQSSSATITIVQNVYGHVDGITLSSVMGMVVGLNIGTTMTGLVASIGGPKDTKRITFIWFFVNFIMAFVFLVSMPLIVDTMNAMMPNVNSSSSKILQLALGDIGFNVILVFVFIWLVNPLEKLSNKIIKPSKENQTYDVNLPQELLNEQPILAFEAAKKATSELGKMTLDSIYILKQYLNNGTKEVYKKYKSLIQLIDITRKVLSNYLVEIGSKKIDKKTSNQHMSIILSARSLERIPILGNQLISSLWEARKKDKFDLHKEDIKEFNDLLNIVNSITKRGIGQLRRYSQKRKNEMKILNIKLSELVEKFSKNHVQRKSRIKFDYLAEIKLLERMGHHALRLQRYSRKGNKEVDQIRLDEKLEKELSINID